LRKAPTKAELSGQSSVKALLDNREQKMLTESQLKKLTMQE